MKLPEPEWFTIEMLASRWRCNRDVVEHYLATYKPNNERMLDAEYKESPSPREWLSPLEEEKVRRLVIHPYPFGRFPCGEVVVMRKEVERFESENHITDISNSTGNDFDMAEYIRLNRGKIKDDEIIYVLREKGFQNCQIGVALGGTYQKGSNALRQSISRKYNKYKNMLGT